MDEIWGILHSLPSAWPQYFTIRGNSVLGFYLMLYPSPGSQGTVTVYYYRQAVAVTASQNIDVQPGWEDVVYDYAVYRARRKDRDPDWQNAKAIYEANLAEMMNRTRDLTDLADVMQTGNVGYPPLYAASGDFDGGGG
jgi:hypothetical protein